MPRHKQSTALAVQGKASLSTAPAFIPEGNQGRENIKLSDAKIPQLKLGQDKSPAVEKGKAEVGTFFNDVTFENFGAEVVVTLVRRAASRTKFAKYVPGKVNIECQSFDGMTAVAMNGIDDKKKPTSNCLACEYSKWGEDGTPPACNEQGKFLVVVEGSDLPMVLFLQRSNMGASKAINTFLLGVNRPIYAYRMKLTAVKKDGVGFIVVAEPAGYVPDEAAFNKSKALHTSMEGAFRTQVAGAAEE